MSAPKRIQLRRTKGWRKPEGAVVVSRPTRWGNPYEVGSGQWGWTGLSIGPGAGFYDTSDERWCDLPAPEPAGLTAAQAVKFYRDDLVGTLRDPEDEQRDELQAALVELRGKDLACWCPLDQPCHADVLLEIANGEAS